MCAYLKLILGLVVFCLLPLSGCAAAKNLALPAGTLVAQEVETLFSGQTVSTSSPDGKKRKRVIYFGTDGRVTQAKNGWLREGNWTVRKDGRLCIKLKGSARDCRIIVKEGNEYRQYAAKLDGNHRHELSYVEFRAGKHLAQMSAVPILPPGTLRRDKVKALFSDRTVESITLRKGRVSRTYYAPGGLVTQLRKGQQRQGRWRVTGNARICLQMEDRKEKCRVIVEEAGEYRKYIIKRNGQHQHSITYRDFIAGNQL